MNSLAGAFAAAPVRKTGDNEDQTLTLAFDDNRLLSILFGEHDENLALIEHRLAVAITHHHGRASIKAGVEYQRAAGFVSAQS